MAGTTVTNIEEASHWLGVQIRPLDDVILDYNKAPGTKVAWAKLRNNPLDQPDHDFVSAILTDFHADTLKSGYDCRCCGLLSTVCPKDCNWMTSDCLRDKVYSQSDYFQHSYFCSQLVATIYQKLGILKSDINPKKLAPMEFLGYSNDHMASPVEMPILIS